MRLLGVTVARHKGNCVKLLVVSVDKCGGFGVQNRDTIKVWLI